jgi:hypothetical protein
LESDSKWSHGVQELSICWLTVAAFSVVEDAPKVQRKIKEAKGKPLYKLGLVQIGFGVDGRVEPL